MRESERIAQIEKGKQDAKAVEQLEIKQTVETPDGWRGFVLEKYPDEGKVAIESWERGGTYRASMVTPVE